MVKVDDILELIDGAVNDFNTSIPPIQKQLFAELTELASQLDTKKGRIKITVKNLKLINQIKNKFDRLLTKNKAYNKQVSEFIGKFSEVAKLQIEYFKQQNQLDPPTILEQIRLQSVEATIDNLKGAGMKANVIDPIRDILKTNITSGAKYTDLVEQLRVSLVDTKEYDGTLTRHTKQITTDALHFYARENIKAITRNTDLTWHSYNGGVIDTSRDFCRAMTKKKYFTEEEIPDLLKGNFKEFKEIGGKINPKTNLPYGFIEGTNKDNFMVNLAGFGCRHQAIPVDELAVPEMIRNAI